MAARTLHRTAKRAARTPRPPDSPGKEEWSAPRKGRVNRTLTQQQDDYLKALTKYFTVSAALTKAGVPWNALLRWREEDAEFLVREEQARGELADMLEGEAVRRAFRGIKQPVYQGGLLAGYITQYSDQLLTLMLKAVRPDKFRERTELKVTEPIIKVVAGFDPADVL